MAAGKRGHDKLKKKEARKRKCLSCGSVFTSRGIHNRICKACKISSDFQSGTDNEHLRIIRE